MGLNEAFKGLKLLKKTETGV